MLVLPFSSPWGTMMLGAEGDELRFLAFPGEKIPEGREGESPVLRQGEAWLRLYFAGRDPGPTPPCAPRGTPYRMTVWSLLAEIPYAGTLSYGDLGRLYEQRTGMHTSPRAIGGALGKNPLPIFLPCHRVLGADGSLTGFAGGLAWKARLLELEQGQLNQIMETWLCK